MPAEYQKSEMVINDLFQKWRENFWSNVQLKDYMKVKYGYKEHTAQKYVEYLWHKIKKEVKVDYEKDLAQTVEYMQLQVQDTQDSFIRLQWLKELNKIKGLQINKVQISGDINNIHTIELVTHTNNPEPIPIQESKPESLDLPFEIIENEKDEFSPSENNEADEPLNENEFDNENETE